MSEEDKSQPEPAAGEETPAAPQPVNEKFRELAELEEEIRRRLRSNQRFLDQFLDEDFVDDEFEQDDETPDEENEEL